MNKVHMSALLFRRLGVAFLMVAVITTAAPGCRSSKLDIYIPAEPDPAECQTEPEETPDETDGKTTDADTAPDETTSIEPLKDAEPLASDREAESPSPAPTDAKATPDAEDSASNVPAKDTPAIEAPVDAPSPAPPSSGKAEADAPSPVRSDRVRFRPGLSVDIKVLVSGVVEVDEPGRRISEHGDLVLPLIGNVKLTDRTVVEAQKLLEALYGRFFVRPQVMIEYKMETGETTVSPWGYVTVLGRVKNPGRVHIPPTRDLTVSRAIQLAGGLASSAKGNSILVTRTDGEDPTQIRVNLDRIGQQGNAENDIGLEPGDVVFVPETIF